MPHCWLYLSRCIYRVCKMEWLHRFYVCVRRPVKKSTDWFCYWHVPFRCLGDTQLVPQLYQNHPRRHHQPAVAHLPKYQVCTRVVKDACNIISVPARHSSWEAQVCDVYYLNTQQRFTVHTGCIRTVTSFRILHFVAVGTRSAPCRPVCAVCL